jgi:hypothetical protein
LGLDVKLKSSGAVHGAVTVELFATESGSPMGDALVSTTIATGSVDNFFEVVHAPLEYEGLVEGTQYAVVLGQESSAAAGYEWVSGEDVASGESFGKGAAGSYTDESELGDGWLKIYAN